MNYTVHGILQARILEWVAFPFSRGSFQPRDQTQVFHIAGGFFTSWATREAQEYWSGQPLPSPADLPDPGIELGSPALQADSLPAEPQGKPKRTGVGSLSLLQWISLTQELSWGLLRLRRKARWSNRSTLGPSFLPCLLKEPSVLTAAAPHLPLNITPLPRWQAGCQD